MSLDFLPSHSKAQAALDRKKNRQELFKKNTEKYHTDC